MEYLKKTASACGLEEPKHWSKEKSLWLYESLITNDPNKENLIQGMKRKKAEEIETLVFEEAFKRRRLEQLDKELEDICGLPMPVSHVTALTYDGVNG